MLNAYLLSYLLQSCVNLAPTKAPLLGSYTLFSSLNHSDTLPHSLILVPLAQHLPQNHPAQAVISSLHDQCLSLFWEQPELQIETLAEDNQCIRITGLRLHHLFTAARQYLDKLHTTLQQLKQYDDLPQLGLMHAQLQNLIERLVVLNYFAHSVIASRLPDNALTAITEHGILQLAEVRNRLQGHHWQDEGLPLPAITWPKNRDDERYNQLHYRHLLRNKDNVALRVSLNQLPPASIILDAGIGEGNALRDYKNSGNFTIGMTLHDINLANRSYIDTLVHSTIPDGVEAQKLFQVVREKVKLVIDTYGPGTYAKNPIHALIYLGELLAEGGVATIIVSSVLGENNDQSPIGYATTRRKLPKFFKKYLHLDLQVARTVINSAVSQGAVCFDYHVEIRRALNTSASTETLATLLHLADVYFGLPRPIPKTTSWGNFGEGLNI